MKWLLIIFLSVMVLYGAYIFCAERKLNEKVQYGVMEYERYQREREKLSPTVVPTPTPGIMEKRFDCVLNQWYFVNKVTKERVYIPIEIDNGEISTQLVFMVVTPTPTFNELLDEINNLSKESSNSLSELSKSLSDLYESQLILNKELHDLNTIVNQLIDELEKPTERGNYENN